MDKAVETFLADNYKIIRQLKNSEHGNVWLVTDKTGAVLILKRVNYGGLPYGILKDNPHPLWPAVHFWSEDENETVVIESYASGENLSDKLKKKQYINEREALELIRQMTDGLSVLHRLGVIHRDIKPSNIIDDSGRYRLIDFDAARFVKEKRFSSNDAETLDSGTDTRLLGTRGYAPPEQHGYAPTDKRSDIYALCVTVRELLGPNYHGRLLGILAKGTELDPKRRYANVMELAAAAKNAFIPWYKKKTAAITAAALIILAAALPHVLKSGKQAGDTKDEQILTPQVKTEKTDNPSTQHQNSNIEANNNKPIIIESPQGVEIRAAMPTSPDVQRNIKASRIISVKYGYTDEEVIASTYDDASGDFLAYTIYRKPAVQLRRTNKASSKKDGTGTVFLYNSKYKQLCVIGMYDRGISLYDLPKRGEISINFVELFHDGIDEDRDRELGWWDRQSAFVNVHIIPILCKYHRTEDGKIAMRELLSGKGKRPQSFDMPVLEEKNIQMANIFLSHVLDLLPRVTAAQKALKER